MISIEADSVRMLTDPVLDAAGTEFDLGPVHLEKTGVAPVKAKTWAVSNQSC